MLFKSLILGIFFGSGIFAVKSGIGLFYGAFQKEQSRIKISFLLLFAFLYFMVFGAAAFTLSRVTLLSHLAAIQTFVQSAMSVHLALAGLMLGWGVLLLKQGNQASVKSSGWLLLALPCPVCITVIFFSSAFVIALFPEHALLMVLLLYLAFVLISLMTTGVIHWRQREANGSPEEFLGGAMIMLATYFLISVTVMPQFGDLAKVYRMACRDTSLPSQKALYIFPFITLAATVFATGYGVTVKKIRNLK